MLGNVVSNIKQTPFFKDSQFYPKSNKIIFGDEQKPIIEAFFEKYFVKTGNDNEASQQDGVVP